jgi:hypothetical protein
MKKNLVFCCAFTPRLSLILAPLLLGIACQLHAQTITLNPVADTALRSGAPNNNFGAAVDLPVGVAIPGTPVNRVLLRFDLTEIPPGAAITSATLRMVVVVTGTGPANFGLHRALQDWGEGTKTPIITGGPATAGEATWNARFHPDTLWSAGGGQAGTDFIATPSATAVLSGAGSAGTFTSEQMAEDLQNWLNQPETNFGWFLIALNEPPSTGKRIGSRENSNANARPLLTVEYTLTDPDPPAPPLIFDTALAVDQIRFSFEAQANNSYAVEFRDSLTLGDWNVLTNIPASQATTTLHITNSIASPQRYFRLRTP